jgi:hypothetical protein
VRVKEKEKKKKKRKRKEKEKRPRTPSEAPFTKNPHKKLASSQNYFCFDSCILTHT